MLLSVSIVEVKLHLVPKYKGQIAVEMALRALGGQKLPRVIWTPQALIDSTNVNVAAESIIKWQEPTF